MTLTDEELRDLISTRFGGAALGVDLDSVQRRGRQRRRRARIAVAAVIAVALAGPAAYVLHRQDQANKIAALNRACQDSYTAEVAKTQRVAQLPQSLGAPLIELQRGDAQFRLYTSAPGPMRAMTFDCARMADGSVSGRLSFGSATPAVLGQPMIAYQDYLPDGSTAVVVQMRDSSGVVSVVPASPDVQVAQRDGMAVVWGPREVLADATLSVGDGSLSLARDPMALTATFQEEEFEQYCTRTMAQLPDLSAASLRLTARDDNAWVLKVYRDGGNLAMCAWQMLPDDRANGISYNGPAASVGSSAKATLGTTLSMIETDGSHAWMTGIIPDGTETVDVVLSDGSTVRAQIGDGVYLAWVPGTGAHAKLVMTTATTIYTVAEGKVSQRPR